VIKKQSLSRAISVHTRSTDCDADTLLRSLKSLKDEKKKEEKKKNERMIVSKDVYIR
jgi:hypothetical protein